MDTYKVGDKVTWTSQALGYQSTKTGEVGAVVPQGRYPDFKAMRSLFSLACSSRCFTRDHESYIVLVPQGPKAKPRAYWPHVSNLKRVG